MDGLVSMEDTGRRHGVISGGFDGNGGATADDNPSARSVSMFGQSSPVLSTICSLSLCPCNYLSLFFIPDPVLGMECPMAGSPLPSQSSLSSPGNQKL